MKMTFNIIKAYYRKGIADFTKLFEQMIFVFIGFLFFCYVIFFRLFYKKLTKMLETDLYLKGYYILIFFKLVLIFTFLYLIYINIKKLFKESQKEHHWLIVKMNNSFTKSLQAFDMFLKKKTFLSIYIGRLLESIGLFLFNHFKNNRMFFLLALFILPRVLVLVAFLIDVFIYKELNYTYRFSVLLLVPLVCKYIKNSLQEFWIKNVEVLDNILYVFNPESKQRVFTLEFIYARLNIPKYSYIYNNILEYGLMPEFHAKYENITKYSPIKTMNYYLEIRNNIIIPISSFELAFHFCFFNFYMPYFNIFLYTNYVICWTYILFYSF